MKIILHGILKDRFQEMEIGANNAADAVEGWSRQSGLSDIPLEQRPIIEVVGFETEGKLRAPTDVTELHLYPMMYGGGGAFGKILLGAALIGLVVVAPHIGLTLSAKVGAAIMAAGIGLAVGGITQLFMPSPTVSKSEDPEASKYLGVGSNTTAIGTLIGKGYGRFLIGGQYLSIQVNSSDMVFGTFPSTVPA